MDRWNDCSGDPISDLNEIIDKIKSEALKPYQPTVRVHSPQEFQLWKELGLYGSVAQEEALRKV